MNPFYYIKTLSHHAYFIHSFKDVTVKLKEYLKEKFNIKHEQNPDFYHEKFGTLSIDESRKIKEHHLSKSFVEGQKRIFIIECSNITHEAQNSLLKIFEEPHEDSHFFLVMPSPEILLPTLRSRLLIIRRDIDKAESVATNDIKSFLKLSKKDRVAFVDNLAKDVGDEKISKSDVLTFLAELETNIYKDNIYNISALSAILKARDYMNDRSPSVKQLLEYVAISI